MSGLYLFARIAGTPVAISTEEVEAVVRIVELSPVPGVPPHILGLSALRSRVLTIIDAATLITGEAPSLEDFQQEDRHAIVCNIGGHSYGVFVDGVDDIRTVTVPSQPLCGKGSEAWEPYAGGVIEDEGTSYFVLTLTSFLDPLVISQAA